MESVRYLIRMRDENKAERERAEKALKEKLAQPANVCIYTLNF